MTDTQNKSVRHFSFSVSSDDIAFAFRRYADSLRPRPSLGAHLEAALVDYLEKHGALPKAEKPKRAG